MSFFSIFIKSLSSFESALSDIRQGKLVEVDFSKTLLSEAQLIELCDVIQFSSVTSLNISNSLVSVAVAEKIANLPIKSLIAVNCHLENEQIVAISANQEIEILNVSLNRIRSAGLQGLSKNKSIKSLDISYNLPALGPRVAQLACMVQLVSLNLEVNGVEDNCIVALMQLPNLEKLNLSGNKIGNNGYAMLRKKASLRERYLTHHSIKTPSITRPKASC